ncbi:MAG TPA: hypothetical protein VFA08_01280 [Actinomycetota bacterium]|nr:hypothetical protein [Actinomycetota bacterium]
MKEPKDEAAIWELYEKEIRAALLEESPSWSAREAVNMRLAETYAQLEPYLEAQRTLAIHEGYQQALSRDTRSRGLFDADEPLAVELKKVREEITEQRDKIADLEEQFRDKLQRVQMLRALRESLPTAENGADREPP